MMSIRHAKTPAAAPPMTLWGLRPIAGLLLAASLALLAGCVQERPQSTQTPGLDTGITASTGGGMTNGSRALGRPTLVP